MPAKTKAVAAALICFFIFFSFSSPFAISQTAKANKGIKGVELLTGFATGKLRVKGNYRLIPLYLGFDFNLKPLVPKKIDIFPGLLQFVLEPFISSAYQPDANVEVGNNFLLKIGFLPETAKLQPYFKGGLGFLYMTQHTREQSTQFNFNEYGGLGLHYFWKKNTALTVEYRFRHLSNSGIKHPNSGINTHYALCGVTYNF